MGSKHSTSCCDCYYDILNRILLKEKHGKDYYSSASKPVINIDDYFLLHIPFTLLVRGNSQIKR